MSTTEYTAHVVNLEGKRKSKKYKQLKAVESYAVEQSQKPQVSEVRIDSSGKHVATCRTGKWTLPVSIEHPKPRAAASLQEILAPPVVDIMAALEASLKETTKRKPAAAAKVSKEVVHTSLSAKAVKATSTTKPEPTVIAERMASWTALPPTNSGDVSLKGRGAKALTRVYLGRALDDPRGHQMVQLLEGLPALIEAAVDVAGTAIHDSRVRALKSALAKLPPLDVLRAL